MAFQPHPDLPPALFKYATPVAATAILESGTLQFSRPSLFNDDFDLRINLAIEVDEDQVVGLALDQMWEALFGPEQIPPGNVMGVMLLAIRQLQRGHMDRAAFDEFMTPTVRQQVATRREWATGMAEALGEECSTYKVLCLSDTGTSANLWGHYTNNMSGVALKFAPDRNSDSFFLAASPVTYVDQVPSLHSTESFADLLSGRGGSNDAQLRDLFLYTKTMDWAPEREWRVVAGEGWEPAQETELVRFAREDLAAVIFGTRATPEFREAVAELVHGHYPLCRFQELRRSRVGLNYEIFDVGIEAEAKGPR